MSALHRWCLIVLIAGLLFVTAVRSSCAAPIDTGIARFDAAIRRAVSYLQSRDVVRGQGQTLVAYAMLKAGAGRDSKHVSAGIATALQRAHSTGYSGYNHIYLCGIDAMLLADSKEPGATDSIQSIVNYVQSAQKADGSWSDRQSEPGDVSMTQYGMLTLWAAQRVGCNVAGAAVDRAGAWLMQSGNSDGGWPYRPGTNQGPGRGSSTHNMTMAAAGSLSIARILLHGDREATKSMGEFGEPKKKYGVLERKIEEEDVEESTASNIENYKPKTSARALDQRVDRSFDWIDTRFTPVNRAEHRIYFYYALERAAVLNQRSDDWYTQYGDGLLTLQEDDGRFNTHSGPEIGTAFAILFLMRSTEQIMESYGRGRMRGARDLQALLDPDSKNIRKDIGPLDDLLNALEGQDFASLDISTDDLVEKIQYGSRDELIGQADKLKILMQHPDAHKRQIAFWALGRTADFHLIPLMLQGLKDPNIDVNVEAIQGLRNIARRPNGFGLTLNPLGHLPKDTDETTRVAEANKWRTKCSTTWIKWYRNVRPYEERDDLDELDLLGRQ